MKNTITALLILQGALSFSPGQSNSNYQLHIDARFEDSVTAVDARRLADTNFLTGMATAILGPLASAAFQVGMKEVLPDEVLSLFGWASDDTQQEFNDDLMEAIDNLDRKLDEIYSDLADIQQTQLETIRLLKDLKISLILRDFEANLRYVNADYETFIGLLNNLNDPSQVQATTEHLSHLYSFQSGFLVDLDRTLMDIELDILGGGMYNGIMTDFEEMMYEQMADFSNFPRNWAVNARSWDIASDWDTLDHAKLLDTFKNFAVPFVERQIVPFFQSIFLALYQGILVLTAGWGEVLPSKVEYHLNEASEIAELFNNFLDGVLSDNFANELTNRVYQEHKRSVRQQQGEANQAVLDSQWREVSCWTTDVCSQVNRKRLRNLDKANWHVHSSSGSYYFVEPGCRFGHFCNAVLIQKISQPSDWQYSVSGAGAVSSYRLRVGAWSSPVSVQHFRLSARAVVDAATSYQ